MLTLLDALDGSDEDQVLTGLRRARQWFARSEGTEEERTDAEVYGLAVEVLLAFSSGQTRAHVEALVARLRERIRQRHLWQFGMHESWLAPRYQAEMEWLRLSALLGVATDNLERPSWLEPRAALAQTLEAYSASRSIRLFARSQTSGVGLPAIIEPRIEGAFVRHEGLRAHLADWLQQAASNEDYREAAEQLRARLETADAPKKVLL